MEQKVSAAYSFATVLTAYLLLIAAAPAFSEKASPSLKFTMYEASLGTTDNGTLDPLRTYQMLYFNLQHQIFETLVSLDLNTQKLMPCLAASWEKRSNDAWRFHLRRGVRFHNGEPFTAEAVKFTLELMKDPRNKFGGRFLFESIAAVQAVDDYTVDILLRTPDALLLRKLSSVGFMFPPKYYTRAGEAYFSRYPVGTGPFRFFYYTKSGAGLDEVHLVTNEDYWRADSPHVKELVYIFIPRDRQWAALQQGDIDMLITQYPGSVSQVRASPAFSVFARKALRNSVCLFNVDKPGPLADLRVRKAVQHAVSRSEIIDKVLKGYGTPLSTIAPGGTMSHATGPALYDEDRSKSLALLKEAGYEKGFTLRVVASRSHPTDGVVSVLAEQLGRIGIRAEVTLLSRDEIIKEIVSPKLMGAWQPSRYDLWVVTGWPDIFGTGSHFYFMFLTSRGLFNFGASVNRDSDVDRLYAKAVEASDDAALARRLQALDRYCLDQSLALPLYQTQIIYAMKKNVHFDPGYNDLPLSLQHCIVDQ